MTQLQDVGVGDGVGVAVAQEALPGGKAQTHSALSPAICPSRWHGQSPESLEGSMLSCQQPHLSPHGPSPSHHLGRSSRETPTRANPFSDPHTKRPRALIPCYPPLLLPCAIGLMNLGSPSLSCFHRDPRRACVEGHRVLIPVSRTAEKQVLTGPAASQSR